MTPPGADGVPLLLGCRLGFLGWSVCHLGSRQSHRNGIGIGIGDLQFSATQILGIDLIAGFLFGLTASGKRERRSGGDQHSGWFRMDSQKSHSRSAFLKGTCNATTHISRYRKQVVPGDSRDF